MFKFESPSLAPKTPPSSKHELIDLDEKLFEQYLSFSRAVAEVKKITAQPDSSKEQAIGVLEKFNFSKKQTELFISGINKLYQRREITQKIKQQYVEQFENEAPTKIFQAIFHCSGNFGSVEIYPDENNLILICDDPIDVGQTLNTNMDLFMAAQQDPEIPIPQVREEAITNTPAGIFINKPIEINGLGTLEGIIIINRAVIQSRGTDISHVIKHEQQHAENSLYYRPAIKETLDQSKDITHLVSMFQEIIDDLKTKAPEETSKLENTAENQNYIIDIFNKINSQLQILIEKTKKNTLDAVIKEELLAFYMADEPGDEIAEMLPQYMSKAEEVYYKALELLDKLVFNYLSSDLAKALNINVNNVRDRLFWGSIKRIAGIKLAQESEIHDPLANIYQQFENIQSVLRQNWEAGHEKGLQILNQIKQYQKTNPDFHDTLIPLLISQPIDKWETIYQNMLKKFNL